MADDNDFDFCMGRKLVMLIVVLVVFVGIPGCNGKKKGDDSNASSSLDWQAQDSLTANEILAKMREVYSTARTYHDEAILSLSYRLQGRFLDEPHQWGVEFQRPNELRASVYNARLRSDGRTMSCFVYDFGSGNLGDQWQVHNVNGNLPLGRFFQDGICRHYLTGQTDLPVDRSNEKVAEMFFPPTVGLLTGQAKIDWLDRGSCKRKPDRTIETRFYHSIEVTCDDLIYELLIDATSFLLSEIRYPIKALDGRLLKSPDVENLEIVARFKGATTAKTYEQGHFELQMPPEAISVCHFVAVPEPFPSPMIARSVAHLGLLDLRGQPVNQADWKGKVALLAWSSDGLFDDSWASVFSQLASELPVQDYHIATVSVVPVAVPGDSAMNDAMQNLRPEKVMANYADPGFEGGKALGLTEWPFYAVIDRQGVLQYVYANQADPPDVKDVRSVLLRVRSGDDVASEMRSEYEKFLDQYQERLATALVNPQGTAAKSSGLADLRPPEEVVVRQLWNVKELVQPANMISDETGSGTFLVVDGWRTIVTLDGMGKVCRRSEISLPPRESINVVRKSFTSGLLVVYSIAGRHVHVIDDEGKELFRVFDAKGSSRVRDARLADLNGDGIDELYISWTGDRRTEVYRPDAADEKYQEFTELSWRDSAIVLDRDNLQRLIVCDEDSRLQLVTVDRGGVATVKTIATGLDSAVRVHTSDEVGSTSSTCVVGTDSRGEWKSVLLDSQLNQIAMVSVGPQQFTTQIEPVAHARVNGSQPDIWSIAGSDGSVTLISDDGQLTDRWNTGNAIDGIAMIRSAGSLVIVLAGEQRVTAWQLTIPGTE